MNKRIWFDLDETLVQTFHRTQGLKGEDFFLKLEDSVIEYSVFVNPYAAQIIEYASQIVGHENVFILTRAEKDYAMRINELAGFAIDPFNIHDRQFMEFSKGCFDWPAKSGGNLLVDDMEYHEITDKVDYLSLRRDQFLNVPVFQFNSDLKNQLWYFKVRAFLKENIS